MKFPPRLVYVAGAIGADSKEKRHENIDKGQQAGIEIWKMGGIPIVPHLNSLGATDAGVELSAIYLGDLEILSACHVMYRIPGWEKSRGVNYETAWANHNGIPIFDTLESLKDYLNSFIIEHPDPSLNLTRSNE